MRASLTRLHWRPRVGQRFQARRLAPEPEQADPRDSLGPPQEAPLLKRPVLLVHGFNSGPGAWEGLRTWLTRGGLNKDGGVVQAETAEIDPEGRVFSMQFSRACNPVSVNAQELRQAIDLDLDLHQVPDVRPGRLDGGFWTPSTAFGDDLVERLEAHAGLRFEVLD